MPLSLPLALRPKKVRDRLVQLLQDELARVTALAQVKEAEARFRAEQGERATYAEEKARCAADYIYWMEHWCWTYDPRLVAENKIPYIPFKPWPKQVDFLHFVHARVEAREPWLCDKSRDQGVTYLCCAYAVWRWLFSSGFKTTFGSRDDAQVDNRDNPDSIFEKIRIILRRLPAWMMPEGFSWRRHDNIAQLTNPENGATITGEGGDSAGRGGRSTLYVADEAAFIRHPAKVEAALSGNTECIGWVSTVSPEGGMGNFFARKKAAMPSGQTFRLHWRDDPRKDEEWGRRKKASLSDPVTWEAEYEINYSAATDGIIVPGAWVRSAQRLLELVPDLPRGGRGVSGGDVGGGKAKSVVAHRFGPIILPLERRQDGDTEGTAHWMLDCCQEAGTRLLNFDSVGIGAGVASTLAKTRLENGVSRAGINTGNPPTDRVWPGADRDGRDDRTSKEMFANLKAEIWWLMRQAFQRTHWHVLHLLGEAGGQAQDLRDLIAIPEDAALATQLSTVKYFRNDKGKIIVESKEKLSSRGIPSPDEAEALVLTFVEDDEDDISGIVMDTGSFHRRNPWSIG